MGEHKAYHFSHSLDSNCSVESIQHQLAKSIIAESISDSITTAHQNPVYHALSNKTVLALKTHPIANFVSAKRSFFWRGLAKKYAKVKGPSLPIYIIKMIISSPDAES